MKRYSSEDVALLKVEYANFVSALNDVKLEDNIANLLLATKTIDIKESMMLIGLTSALTHEIEWRQVCEIYKYSLRFGDPTEGIYTTWLVCALEILKKEEQESRCENGLQVIADSLRISNDALQDYPRHSGFAFLSGYFSYGCAKHYDVSPAQFEKALSWFRQSAQWQQEDKGEVDDDIKFYLGQSYLALHDWKTALAYDKSVDQKFLVSEHGEEMLKELRAGILLAEAKL
jgi:hypothetical protein